MSITYIWIKFGTEHRYHNINTPVWPNSHKLKIQDGGGGHIEFRKNACAYFEFEIFVGYDLTGGSTFRFFIDISIGLTTAQR